MHTPHLLVSWHLPSPIQHEKFCPAVCLLPLCGYPDTCILSLYISTSVLCALPYSDLLPFPHHPVFCPCAKVPAYHYLWLSEYLRQPFVSVYSQSNTVSHLKLGLHTPSLYVPPLCITHSYIQVCSVHVHPTLCASQLTSYRPTNSQTICNLHHITYLLYVS